jgi:hypothetical protein
MRCPSCDSENPADRPACAGCGQDLSVAPSAGDDGWKNVVLWVAIVALLASGGWITFSSWPGRETAASPSSYVAPASTEEPSEPADPSVAAEDQSSQAAAMNELLLEIQTTRSGIPDSLGGCGNVEADLSALERVVQERTQEATEAGDLRTDQLTDGAELGQALVDMTQSTLDADQEYLTWAKKAQSSGDCTDVGDGGTIGAANQTAADAKRRFVGLWNGYAGQFGQQEYSWKDF